MRDRKRRQVHIAPAARWCAAFLEPLESRVLLTADDQISEAILKSIPSTTNATIDVGTDVDMYKFAVSADQTVAFDTDVTPNSLDTYIRLFNGSGTPLAFSDDTPAPGEMSGLGSYLEYTFTSAGTFYLGVSSWNNSAYDPVGGGGDSTGTTTGNYTLILTNIPQNQPPTIGSLTDSPDPVTVPATFTLTANSVADPDGTVASVQFFRESNGVAGFQVGDDSLLATDTTAPYSATIATSALPAGTHTYYARAVDNLGLGGNSPSTTHTLNAPTGSISGKVWNDANGNKLFDAGEALLPDWVVYLDNNRNQILDGGDVSTTTNGSGAYTFSGLTARTYYVTTQTPAGWEQTSPGASGFVNPASAPLSTKGSGVIAQSTPKITTTGSTVPVYPLGAPTKDPGGDGTITPKDAQSNPLIRLTNFQADPRFNTIRGQGFSVAVLDTGIDRDHPAFGPDTNADGRADRIVYEQDFANGDMNAQDFDGHGTNVASIVGSQDATHPGMAPQVNIIALKVFTDAGSGHFGYIEAALQWVIANANNPVYNIAAINMSLGDSGNYNTTQSLYGIADEMATLAGMNVMVVSAAGNDFYEHSSKQGVSYPAADPNSLAVSAVYDANVGPQSYGGPSDFSTAADRITSFSQRSWTMTHAMAPGALITGGNSSGGNVSYPGTSQAAPHIAGIAALAQQIAMRDLGRRLTLSEFKAVLKSGVLINDGDDENDNVANTGAYFRRVDVLNLGEAILAMAPGAYTQSIVLTHGENDAGVDFGSRNVSATGSISGKTFDDYDGDDLLDPVEPARPGVTVYIDANGNNARDPGETMAVTDGAGTYTFSTLVAGSYDIRQEVPADFIGTIVESNVVLGSGGTVTNAHFGEFRVVHTGTGGNDTYTLRRDAGGTKLELVAGAVTWSKSLTSINTLSTTGVDINLGGGDDTLTVNHVNGAPMPNLGIDYDGGGQSTPSGDRLIVLGAGAGETYNLFNNRVTRAGDVNSPFYAGLEGVTIDALGGGDTINFPGAPTIPVTVNGGDGNDTLNVNVAPIAPIVFNGGLAPLDADTLNVNAGTFTFDADANLGTANLQVNVNNAGTNVAFNTTQHLAGLTVNGGAVATLASNGGRYLFTKNLVIATGGKLDLADNDLLWDYEGASPYTTVRSFILDGRIASTVTAANDTTLAPADNVDHGATEWLGQSINPTTIIGKYTYYGDANLDGKVTSDDYVAVDVGLGIGNSWVQGDFNLNGTVTSDDYVAIDVNLGKGAITPLAAAEPAAVTVVETTAPTAAPSTVLTEPEAPTIEQVAAGTITTAWTKPRKLQQLKKSAARR